MQENALIKWLQGFSQAGQLSSWTGIGDDAAVIDRPGSDLVVTTDLIADGTHFISSEATPAQIGRKAMAVNLSDVAAMAARPLAAFVSLLLPCETSEDYAKALMSAMRELGQQFDCPIMGGDTNVWSGKLAINVLVIAQTTARGPLLRSTAMPGDILLVTGALGGSIAGRHFDFQPRVQESLLLAERYDLNAGMDLSDGLAMDVRRLCQQSGCGAEVELDRLPVSEVLGKNTASPEEATRRALGDGEDFELLLAVRPVEADRMLAEQPLGIPLTKVGHCVAEDGVWQIQGGRRTPLPMAGFEHGGPS